VVSHDRAFLDAVATGILAFEGDGTAPAKVTLYQGNYDTYTTLKAEAAGVDALVVVSGEGREGEAGYTSCLIHHIC
jgi:ATPase subunit of ABC transporter with duplicated ATPase domains